MMNKVVRFFVAVVALVAFGMVTMSVAADYYAVKDASGKISVVDKKPADEKSIVKGPFKSKADAENAVKAPVSKPPRPPAEGC